MLTTEQAVHGRNWGGKTLYLPSTFSTNLKLLPKIVYLKEPMIRPLLVFLQVHHDLGVQQKPVGEPGSLLASHSCHPGWQAEGNTTQMVSSEPDLA